MYIYTLPSLCDILKISEYITQHNTMIKPPQNGLSGHDIQDSYLYNHVLRLYHHPSLPPSLTLSLPASLSCYPQSIFRTSSSHPQAILKPFSSHPQAILKPSSSHPPTILYPFSLNPSSSQPYSIHNISILDILTHSSIHCLSIHRPSIRPSSIICPSSAQPFSLGEYDACVTTQGTTIGGSNAVAGGGTWPAVAVSPSIRGMMQRHQCPVPSLLVRALVRGSMLTQEGRRGWVLRQHWTGRNIFWMARALQGETAQHGVPINVT